MITKPLAILPIRPLSPTRRKEEYHHGGNVEAKEYVLESEIPGSFVLDVETRYNGKQEYALYRIPYEGGEFRFILTFDVGAKDALYAMWAEK